MSKGPSHWAPEPIPDSWARSVGTAKLKEVSSVLPLKKSTMSLTGQADHSQDTRIPKVFPRHLWMLRGLLATPADLLGEPSSPSLLTFFPGRGQREWLKVQIGGVGDTGLEGTPEGGSGEPKGRENCSTLFP